MLVLVALAVEYFVELRLASNRRDYVRHEWTSAVIVVTTAERVARVHPSVGLGVDQGPMGTVDGPIRTRPHPQPAHRPLPHPDTPPGAPIASPPIAVVPPSLPPTGNCDPSYPDVCIPPAPPDLDCGDITDRRFRVLPPDPHRFDGDGNGIGCES